MGSHGAHEENRPLDPNAVPKECRDSWRWAFSALDSPHVPEEPPVLTAGHPAGCPGWKPPVTFTSSFHITAHNHCPHPGAIYHRLFFVEDFKRTRVENSVTKSACPTPAPPLIHSRSLWRPPHADSPPQPHPSSLLVSIHSTARSLQWPNYPQLSAWLQHLSHSAQWPFL